MGEFVSGHLKSLFPSPSVSLNLPVEDTPFVPYDPPELWVKASGNVQAAIDKGASTVYIPFGEYRHDKTIVIRGPVRRIHALNANVWAGKGLGDTPLFRFEGAAKACVMEWMDSGTVEHASPNALVIRDCTGLAPATTPNCGPTFVENDCSDHWTLRGPARVYGRSVNLEHADFDIRNLGAALWILGFKSERPGLQVETRDGGFTEILGGLVYPCAAVPADRPMFVNHESSLSVMIRQNAYVANGIHKIKVQETRDGETRNLEEIGENLYVGYKAPPRLADKANAARKREETKKEEKSDNAADVGAPKPAAPKPVSDASAVAAWDAKLKARLQEELKEGRKPRFTFSMLGQECRFAAIDEKDAIRIQSGGSAMDLTWKALTLEDRKGLVIGLLREDRADDIALAAFFHLAAGDVEKGQGFLARAGSAGEAVKSAFRQ